jgi:hypothetical protein
MSSRRGQLKCDSTRAETRFRLLAKRTSPLKSAGASVQSTTGSRGVRISSSNAGYTMFRGSVMGSGYSLHSLVSPSLPLPCVTVCHHISTGLYPTFLSHFNETWISSIEAELFHAGGRIRRSQLVAFRNFANAANKLRQLTTRLARA